MEQQHQNMQGGEAGADRLSRLFGQYRDACPEMAGSPDFVPRLWQQIEARQSFGRRVGRLARGFIGLAAASCAVMLFLLIDPGSQAGFYDSSYVDVLASAHSTSADLPGDLGSGENANPGR
jgi:hypothetical protein